MSRRGALGAILGVGLVAGLLMATSYPSSETVDSLPYAPDHVLIKFKPEATETDRMVFRSELQADRLHTFASRAELWKLPDHVTVESAIRLLQDDELIEYIEPDCHMSLASTIPADANFPQQWC